MPKIKFNALKIKSLKPHSRSVEYFEDGRTPGNGAFGIRVSPKGKMVWFIMYKNETGAIKRYRVGDYPKLSLKDASKEANKAMDKVNNGQDPQAQKQTFKKAPTMTELWEEYQKALARRNKPKAPATIREEKRRWEKVIQPNLGSTKVVSVKRPRIAALLNEVADTAPVSANRLHSLLSVMFKTALDLGWLEVHPMYMMSKPGGQEVSRKRYLEDKEIKIIWPYLDKLQPNSRDILKLILLTAQRPGEIMAMKWEDLNLDEAVWRLTENKTDSTHLVPLSDPVIQIIKARKEGQGYTEKQMWMTEAEFVFPSRYNKTKGAKTEHSTSTKNARNKVKQDSSISGWTSHDLRRTARTIMSRLKIKQHVRERVLNHSQGGVVGVYDQFDYLSEKRNALDKLAREIYRIVGQPIATTKVIKLKAA